MVPCMKGRERRISLNRRWHQPLAITFMSVLSSMHIWSYMHIYMIVYIYTLQRHTHITFNTEYRHSQPFHFKFEMEQSSSTKFLNWLQDCRWFTFLLEELGPLKSCPLGTRDFHAFYAVGWAACTPVASIVACLACGGRIRLLRFGRFTDTWCFCDQCLLFPKIGLLIPNPHFEFIVLTLTLWLTWGSWTQRTEKLTELGFVFVCH